MVSLLLGTAVARAETGLERIDSNHGFFSEDRTSCTIAPTAGGTNVDVNDVEAGNAKIVIGIAKTDGLDQNAALIGLMVAITESHLQNYANSNVPISLTFPHDLVGSDHDSVGIFQQRPSTGWSTFSTGQAALSDPAAVQQLMTPAYAAEAFFGSPPNTDPPAPPALSKGLQNIGDWQSMNPWEAAQKVQASGTPDGSNYKAKMEQAQSLLAQFWDEAPAVPLPVPFTGGTPNNGSAKTNCATAVSGNLMQTIFSYAWPDYHAPPYITEKPEYQTAIEAAQAKGEYVGGVAYPGVDCGGFVTRVMRDSGTDPDYNAYNSNTLAQERYMKDHPEKYQLLTNVGGTNDLQPGDIAINSDHTYIYVGSIPGFNGNSASASLGDGHGTGSDRSPMASNAYGFADFRWYRLIKGASQ